MKTKCFLRSMHKATILSPLDTTLKIVMLVKVLGLAQGTRSIQSLENVIEEQSNYNELNMAQETTCNPRNGHTISAEKSAEKLPSSTDHADNNFVSSDVDNLHQ